MLLEQPHLLMKTSKRKYVYQKCSTTTATYYYSWYNYYDANDEYFGGLEEPHLYEWMQTKMNSRYSQQD